MSVVALICARGGSKGLPGKNIRPLAGKPLIGWAIEQARQVERVKRVIVSTDSDEIATIAGDFGAEIPFLRPGELAQDNSPEWMVWRHALKYLKETEGVLPDTILMVPTTAPLRSVADLDASLDQYQKNNFDIVVAVTDAHRNPYFNMVRLNQDETVEIAISPEGTVTRRQDAPVVYDMTTVAYVTNPEFVFHSSGIFDGRVGYVHVPTERALDIDTALDFRIAECLISDR